MNEIFERIKDDAVAFAQKVVQTKSMTCDEKGVAELVKAKMEELGYDEVTVDATGNVLGRIGHGAKKILFDSHMDTVTVIDADQWADDPYGGIIKDGKLYGRGSVDMKCPLVASVYGAYVAKEWVFQKIQPFMYRLLLWKKIMTVKQSVCCLQKILLIQIGWLSASLPI